MNEKKNKVVPDSVETTKKESNKIQTEIGANGGVSTSTSGGEPQAAVVEKKKITKHANPSSQLDGSKLVPQKKDAEDSTSKEAKELKKTIKALRLSNAKARKLLNVIDIGLAFHDLVRDADGKPVDYRLREVNPAFEAILELTAADTIGKLASKVYGKRGRAPFLRDISGSMEGGEAKVFEGTVRSTQGRLRFSMQPIDKDLFALLIEDATEEARARRRRAFLETRLKTVTRERKAALAELADFRAEAKKLNRHIKALQKDLDLALKESANRAAALESETVELNRERGKRARLEAALAAAAEVRNSLRGVASNLSKALKVK